MGKRIFYEWIIETVETKSGDIHDVNHSVSFPTGYYYLENGKLTDGWTGLNGDTSHIDIALRKEDDSFLGWEYAYLENGKLPEFFDDGYRIPKRFHNEIKKEQN